MALYLEGKTSVDTNELSPKEATQMSHEVKYIGMDVHKEALVIAVLNAGGKVVMESVIETKASSILQFLNGLRGELHVTWEEGTWAAWLYDLLQPQVQHIVVLIEDEPVYQCSPYNLCGRRTTPGPVQGVEARDAGRRWGLPVGDCQ